jgi:hypothetical protein
MHFYYILIFFFTSKSLCIWMTLSAECYDRSPPFKCKWFLFHYDCVCYEWMVHSSVISCVGSCSLGHRVLAWSTRIIYIYIYIAKQLCFLFSLHHTLWCHSGYGNMIGRPGTCFPDTNVECLENGSHVTIFPCPHSSNSTSVPISQ